jgi:hypothetical protein
MVARRMTPYSEVERQVAQSPDFLGLCESPVARDSMTEAVSAAAGEQVSRCLSSLCSSPPPP